MNEFKFKFVYNGKDSFLNLMDNIRFSTKADKIGRYWKGIIKINGENIYRSEGCYIMVILFKIIEVLEDKENVFVEMDLYY